MDDKDLLMLPMVYGYIPSLIDGTETVIDVNDKLKIPEEFSWLNILPPVRNLGLTLTCACLTVTCVLDFLKNSELKTPGICNKFSIDTLYNMRSNKPLEGMSIKEALEIVKTTGLNNMKIPAFALVPSVEAVKYSCMMFGPVLIGTIVYNSNITKFWKKPGRSEGGHCFCVIGWNSSGFIIRNSWGTGYGNKGYAQMSYSDFLEYVLEAWTVTI